MRPNPRKKIGSNRYFPRHTSLRTLITIVCAVLLGGCAADRPTVNPKSLESSVSPTSATSPKLPPLPDQAETTTTSPAARARADGQCGTVTAASGFKLRVMPGEAGCRSAERVIAAFHAAIAGQQPAGSRRPVKATVDGWNCVSGPPSSQGGSSCSKGDTDVLAAVITDE